jgi:hypothetical protein
VIRIQLLDEDGMGRSSLALTAQCTSLDPCQMLSQARLQGERTVLIIVIKESRQLGYARLCKGVTRRSLQHPANDTRVHAFVQ